MIYTLIDFKNAGQDQRGNNKIYAKFKEYENGNTQVYWGAKNLPSIGNTYEGDITVTQYGPRFTRSFNPQNKPTMNGQPSPDVKREDGMRQGMAINNAANFVKDVLQDKTLTPNGWAELVGRYATALYKLDITRDPIDTVHEPTDEELGKPVGINDVKQIFGV